MTPAASRTQVGQEDSALAGPVIVRGPGGKQPRQIAHQRARIFHVLDGLNAGDYVGGSGRKRNGGHIQIGSAKLGASRELRISDQIDAEISLKPGADVAPEQSLAAANIEQD